MKQANPIHPTDTDTERFLEKVDKTEDCWIWTAGKFSQGYGAFHLGRGRKGKVVSAHRYAYAAFVGELTEGLVVDHICRNPSCVNPDHLRELTHQQNLDVGLRTEAQKARHLKTRTTPCKKCGSTEKYHQMKKGRNGKFYDTYVCHECRKASIRKSLARRRAAA